MLPIQKEGRREETQQPTSDSAVPADGNQARRRWQGEVLRWSLSFLLILPAATPYLAHYFGSGQLVPTGFIQGDQPSYMAVAREYFEGGHLSLVYGNPFNPDYQTPAIYFQPQTLLLGLVWRLSGWDAGLVFVLFGLAAALVCGRVALGLFEAREGLRGRSRAFGLLLFFWGGGFLVLLGALSTPLQLYKYGGALVIGNLFQFDPFEGWWFLNFGRNLVFPLEAYYHALFFGSILAIGKRRYGIAAVLALLLSVSHPYSGSELLAIFFAWAFLEVVVVRRGAVPFSFFAAVGVICALHVCYYLLYLPTFPEHRAVVAQWSKPWILEPVSALGAYALVGVFAAWTLRRRKFLSDPFNRLLLVWFLVAFALVEHHLFTSTAVQPLHFTRGYVWTPLFLIGARSIVGLIDWLRAPGGLVRRAGLVLCVALFLSDNLLWFAAIANGHMIQHTYLTAGQRDLLRWMDKPENFGTLLLTPDNVLAGMATVYTPMRSWSTHKLYETGDVARRAQLSGFFLGEEYRHEWDGRRLMIVFDNVPDSISFIWRRAVLDSVGRGVREAYRNPEYTAYIAAESVP